MEDDDWLRKEVIKLNLGGLPAYLFINQRSTNTIRQTLNLHWGSIDHGIPFNYEYFTFS
jgi:hypothetical protein